MRRWISIILRNCWFGLSYSALALIGSVMYTWLAGPLFGQMNAAATAFMVLLLCVLTLAGIVAFFRQPNPYVRSSALFNFDDIPEQLRGKLDSGGDGWIWQAAPMVVVGTILLPFFT